jgi:hypothetical protein
MGYAYAPAMLTHTIRRRIADESLSWATAQVMLHGLRGRPAEAEDLIREYCPTKEDVRKESQIRAAICAIEEANGAVETTPSECELWKEVAAETVAENMQAWWQAAVAGVAVGVPQRRLDVALAGLEGIFLHALKCKMFCYARRRLLKGLEMLIVARFKALAS